MTSRSYVETLLHHGWNEIQRVDGLGPCWEYRGARDPKNYGCMKMPRRYAHRVSYEHHVGPIGPGQVVRHRCDNPPCVNPAHLVVGTKGDNQRDMQERGRSTRGERSGVHRRSEASIDYLHLLASRGMPHEGIADLTGLRQGYISKIISGSLWPHVAEKWQIVKRQEGSDG